MRYLSTLLLLASIIFSCKKDDPCKSCTLTLLNGRIDYAYSVTVGNLAPFDLAPGGTKTITLDSSRPYNILGDLQTPFASDDFFASVQCDGDCKLITVTLK